MKAETREMLAQVEKAHDWLEGEIHAGNGTETFSTDICRACSLRRHYFNDRNQGATFRFSDGVTKKDVSLRQAVLKGCHA